MTFKRGPTCHGSRCDWLECTTSLQQLWQPRVSCMWSTREESHAALSNTKPPRNQVLKSHLTHADSRLANWQSISSFLLKVLHLFCTCCHQSTAVFCMFMLSFSSRPFADTSRYFSKFLCASPCQALCRRKRAMMTEMQRTCRVRADSVRHSFIDQFSTLYNSARPFLPFFALFARLCDPDTKIPSEFVKSRS